MATTVCWETSTESWIVDNQEGDERFFDDKVDAINCAYDLEQNKDEPDCVLVYKKMVQVFQKTFLYQNDY